jgi:hypothetical protein
LFERRVLRARQMPGREIGGGTRVEEYDVLAQLRELVRRNQRRRHEGEFSVIRAASARFVYSIFVF